MPKNSLTWVCGFVGLWVLPAGFHAQQGQLAALTLTAVLVGVSAHGCVQLKPAEMPGHVVLHLLGYQRISVLKLSAIAPQMQRQN